MKIFMASDHAGFELKKKLEEFLNELGHEVVDLGNDKYDDGDDYPDWIILAAREVVKNPGSRGIILGGSGQGEAMVANRLKGVRAAVFYGGPIDMVKISRRHNDSNILSLGARFIFEEESKEAVRVWLEAPYLEEERHKRRIAKIDS